MRQQHPQTRLARGRLDKCARLRFGFVVVAMIALALIATTQLSQTEARYLPTRADETDAKALESLIRSVSSCSVQQSTRLLAECDFNCLPMRCVKQIQVLLQNRIDSDRFAIGGPELHSMSGYQLPRVGYPSGIRCVLGNPTASSSGQQPEELSPSLPKATLKQVSMEQ